MYDVLVGVILTKMFIEEDNIICNNSVSPYRTNASTKFSSPEA